MVLILFLVADCNKNQETDPCLKTKWPEPKVYEIKLAIHILPSNTPLPGSSAGSQYPEEYESLVVYGNIEKTDCSKSKSGFADIGNNYVNKNLDSPALIDVADAYWIGHVVYVYQLSNDSDKLNLNFSVSITMSDKNSYLCSLSQQLNFKDITQVPMQNYFYILLNVSSLSWVKV